jgi:GT2 family glycosyltransferase
MSEVNSISVVLAGYNEETFVAEAIERHIKMLRANFEDYELILIDDASRDKTASIMEHYSNQDSNVILLKNLVNLNFGTSVLRGLKYATKKYVIYNAIDMPLVPEEIPQIIQEASERDADLMVLERLNYRCTSWRKITSNINLYLLRILFPQLTKGIHVFNFVQVFRTSVINEIIPLARSPIFVWPELIFRAKLKKMHIICKPVAINPQLHIRGGSFGKPHDIIWGIYDMLRFRNRLWGKSI